MARVEVQYAVRVPNPTGGWYVMDSRYGRREPAEFAARQCEGAEVVAQAVMVAGDWGTPTDVERVVRERNDYEWRCEQMARQPLSDEALRELGLYECASCEAPIVRGERCGNCGRGWLVKDVSGG